MAFAQDSQASQKGKEEKFKRGGLNRGRSERYEDTIEYYEQKLSKAKEIGDVKETCETYEVLATAYAAVWNQEDRSHKRRSKHGRNVNSERSLNKGRTERYNIKLDYYNEILKKDNETPGNGLEKYTAYEGLTKTYRAMAIQENKIIEKESNDEWKWIKTSVKHESKFQALHEYARKHPDKIKEINGVRVSFTKTFCVGQGSSGTAVYIGLANDGCEKAVKRVPKCTGSLGKNEKKILNTPNAVNSKRVVRYWYYDEKSDQDGYAHLIFDLHEETLEQYVEVQSHETLTEKAPFIIRQILEGLVDLHSKPEPILHRDLKPSNILRNVYREWLLSDFGISRILSDGKTTHRSKEIGTKHWRAVESYPSQDKTGKSVADEARYKKQSDMQVLGMVCFYILTKGDHPFGLKPDRVRNLLDGNPVDLDKLTDPVAKDLISWMLRHNPKDRPSAEESLGHPFLQPSIQQFELLKCLGNEPEIKRNDIVSVVVRKINNDPLLSNNTWKSQIHPTYLTYLCSDGIRPRRYGDEWTECLRLIRNTSQHWNDRPHPRPEVHDMIGEPDQYFLNLFPTLPMVLHRIIRNDPHWKQRSGLRKFPTFSSTTYV